MASTRLRASLVLLVQLSIAAGLADAASGASVPGRFVVKGKNLAGKRGGDVSVFAKPQGVTFQGCRTRRASVRSKRGRVSLRATARCGQQTVRVQARITGPSSSRATTL